MTKYERIYEPGKFEGELAIVPRMWEVVLDGFSHDVYVDGTAYSFVSLLAVDEPTTEGLYGAMLWETDQGFVMSQWFETEADYKAKIELAEALAEGEAEKEEL